MHDTTIVWSLRPMPFDRTRHHRRSIRLADYDYAQVGAYFVTICAATRRSIFGRGKDGAIMLNPIGQIVRDTWLSLPEHHPHVALDAFVVMPDHVHGIIVFADVPPIGRPAIDEDGDGGNGGDAVGAQRSAPLHHAAPVTRAGSAAHAAPPKMAPGSLGVIVRAFKSAATRAVNIHRNTPAALVWQRNYYEHIVRGNADMDRIRRYIENNPARWRER